MHHRGREVAFGGGLDRLSGLQQPLRDRQDHVVNTCVHEALEENLLRTALFMHAWIIGQIIRNRLVAVPQIPGSKRRVHDLHR